MSYDKPTLKRLYIVYICKAELLGHRAEINTTPLNNLLFIKIEV